jgi:hypothetical protein
VDRFDKHRNTIKAVAGYDATLCAPKSVSVLCGWAECHGIAVNAFVEMIEKYGSTTRIRSNGTRLHPETQGLSVAVFWLFHLAVGSSRGIVGSVSTSSQRWVWRVFAG